MISTPHSQLPLVLLTSMFIVSCGKKSSNDTPESKPTKHNVAVVDEGFDLDNAVFSDNLTASYRVLCVNTGTNPLIKLAPEMRYEDLKTQFLNYLENRSNCVDRDKLNDNISPAFANIAGVYNEWNAAVKAGTKDSLTYRQQVEDIVKGEKGKYNYHGTATAGLIARDNDKINLILIEPELLQLMLPNDVYLDLGCRSQVEIDLKARLFEDKDVRKAFINADREDADSVVLQLLKKHQVTLINESYGPTSAGEFADYYKKKQCAEVDFKRMFIAESRLSRERQEAIEAKYQYRPLHIRSAGNAGKELNLESDTLDPCRDEDNFLIVGSLDRNGEVSDFSNTGRCVEIYTLGTDVIVDAPKDFLDVQSGTSMSAPLLTRYLTLNTEPGQLEKEARGFALDAGDSNQKIGLADWNKDFAYVSKVATPAPTPTPGGNGGQPGALKEGWGGGVLEQEVKNCVDTAMQNNVTQEFAEKYCSCALGGFARKLTYAEFTALGDAAANDPLVAECRLAANEGQQ